VTIKTNLAFTARLFLLRLAFCAVIVLVAVLFARAGNPRNVAGTSYFDPGVTGQPLVWPQGVINYYTDQGDLSNALPNAAANAFVANAFTQWSAVPTAALAVNRAGQLAEDVNGTNVIVNSDGTISLPADIQSTATGAPIGIVYDHDGAVTSALLGTGAGGSSECFYNAVFGGNDNFGSSAAYQHALIVINGQCALQSSQFTDLEYRLVRVIGTVLGLGWSQVNSNVQTGKPRGTPDDYAGFPLMHYIDNWNCIPITLCDPNGYQLAMDDVAAISRLYPVTTQNQSSFPGKQIFSTTTARIHGSVWFTDTHGARTHPMQGVNVIARWIDPSTRLPSHRYSAASVSGFLFSGNEGNPITGYYDILGNPFAVWGSNDPALEGFYDLAGLQLPNGGGAQYQLSVEPIDPLWSAGVGPYSPGPVAPSGSFQPVTVTLSAGADVQQDILMTATAQPLPQASSSWASPVALPAGGDWTSSLGGYGDATYFLLSGQSNRTLSITVTALDESGNPTEVKAQPVIGMWDASDPEGTAAPAFTPAPFNQSTFAVTRLDAQLLASTSYLIGISDLRGDGRPDYRYHAHVLYADSVSPARIGIAGGPISIRGTGFSSGFGASVGVTAATQLLVSPAQMILAAPPRSDGPQDITITDAITGASTQMTAALLYGAAASDNIVRISGTNPPAIVGAQAANSMTVRVLAADGITPVSGATIGWSASNSLQLSACGGTSACSVATDQNGLASTWLTPATVGVSTITATLAPGVYSPAKSVSATLNAIQSASDIGALMPYLWISQGATASVPLMVRVLSNGVPSGNVPVTFTIVSGSGTVSTGSTPTNSAGYATATLSVAQIAALVQVSACANSRCAPFYVTPVPLSQQILQPVTGWGQVSTGLAFQPVVVRVVDSSSPPNPVLGAPIVFQTTTLRPGGTSPIIDIGDTDTSNPAMPAILQTTQSSTLTDQNGLASIAPVAGNFSPPLEVDVAVSAATGVLLDYPLFVLAPAAANSGSDRPITPPARVLHDGGER
jgi:hypothetical protein